jgi:hypothetical protein
MPNPGTYHGARLAFLLEQKPSYTTAVSQGCVVEKVADICRRYFKRFPIKLPLDVDPNPASLAAVNDDEADPDPVLPDAVVMSVEEYNAAMDEVYLRRARITAR